MSELRQEEIAEFWQTCGYRFYDGLVHSRLCKCGLNETTQDECICPKGQCDREAWPDPSDLNAVFEGLEWFCNGTCYTLWKVHPEEVAQFGHYEAGIYAPKEGVGFGDTKQEAIIRAVNFAAVNTAAKEAAK